MGLGRSLRSTTLSRHTISCLAGPATGSWPGPVERWCTATVACSRHLLLLCSSRLLSEPRQTNLLIYQHDVLCNMCMYMYVRCYTTQAPPSQQRILESRCTVGATHEARSFSPARGDGRPPSPARRRVEAANCLSRARHGPVTCWPWDSLTVCGHGLYTAPAVDE